MKSEDYEIMDDVDYDIAWCPGCGNFPLRNVMKQVLAELEIKPQNVVFVSGIGQAAKIPHYLRVNGFNGLHGRALSPAVAIKSSNPNLTVIAESGDGCMYGEGGNHFLHTILRNPDITMFVHNNMVYGLTKGQGSPTSREGFVTSVQTADRGGVTNRPLNPLALAISMGASFVARAFIGDNEESKEIMKHAIQHKGFSIVDTFQPCVTYNQLNTYQWYKENTYYLPEDHDTTSQTDALEKALEDKKHPLGIFYQRENVSTFEEDSGIYEEDTRPLFQREVDKMKLMKLIDSIADGI